MPKYRIPLPWLTVREFEAKAMKLFGFKPQTVELALMVNEELKTRFMGRLHYQTLLAEYRED